MKPFSRSLMSSARDELRLLKPKHIITCARGCFGRNIYSVSGLQEDSRTETIATVRYKNLRIKHYLCSSVFGENRLTDGAPESAKLGKTR